MGTQDRHVDRIFITEDSTAPRRQSIWRVHLQVNHGAPRTLDITEPSRAVLSRNDLDNYVRESANVLAYTRNGKSFVPEHEDLPRWHDSVNDYSRRLFDQLELGQYRYENPQVFFPSARGCIIYIIEDETRRLRRGPSLQRIRWEFLEGLFWGGQWTPHYSIAVSRVIDFKKMVRREFPENLATVQRKEHYTVKILLVIARDLTLTGNNRDAAPHLTQWPLMKIQQRLNLARTRVIVEVVRPGSLQGLKDHLDRRKKQDMHFNIVHFDLHGDDAIKETKPLCRLIFATGKNNTPKQVTSVEAEEVAKVLADYQIEHVVMSSCWSAYEDADRASSMARLFIRANVRGVSAVWGKVGTDTVAAHNEAFYEALLDKDGPRYTTFEEAAHAGRLALRTTPKRWPNQTGYRDDILYVYYSRDNPRVSLAATNPVSDAWRACTRFVIRLPRLMITLQTPQLRTIHGRNGRPIIPQGGVVPLELLLLELEAYLLEYGVVYASDSKPHQSKMKTTVEGLARLWLRTNLIDQVSFHRVSTDDNWKSQELPEARDVMPRHTHGYAWGHRLPKALGGTLHIFEGLDEVFSAIPIGYDGSGGARGLIIRKMREFLAGLSPGDYAIILGWNVENEWMPREWGAKCPRHVQYWHHGSQAYSDEESWLDALELPADYTDVVNYGF